MASNVNARKTHHLFNPRHWLRSSDKAWITVTMANAIWSWSSCPWTTYALRILRFTPDGPKCILTIKVCCTQLRKELDVDNPMAIGIGLTMHRDMYVVWKTGMQKKMLVGGKPSRLESWEFRPRAPIAPKQNSTLLRCMNRIVVLRWDERFCFLAQALDVPYSDDPVVT